VPAALLVSFALNIVAMALVVVAVLQRRSQSREELRVQALQLHVELLRHAATDPDLARLWATERLDGLTDDEIRTHLYLNARVTALEIQWETGGLTPAHLTAAADAALATEAGRRYWERGRDVRAKVAEGMKKQEFHAAFEEAYRSRYGTPVAG